MRGKCYGTARGRGFLSGRDGEGGEGRESHLLLLPSLLFFFSLLSFLHRLSTPSAAAEQEGGGGGGRGGGGEEKEAESRKRKRTKGRRKKPKKKPSLELRTHRPLPRLLILRTTSTLPEFDLPQIVNFNTADIRHPTSVVPTAVCTYGLCVCVWLLRRVRMSREEEDSSR